MKKCKIVIKHCRGLYGQLTQAYALEVLLNKQTESQFPDIVKLHRILFNSN